jgi:sugar O-acyltransferase (sialic acid O-acetyltransferase NeuD family)
MKSKPTVAVLGAGGHAKVVIATLEATGYESIVVFDDDDARWGSRLLGHPVAGAIRGVGERKLEAGIIAIGNNRRRKEIAAMLSLKWVRLVHPFAYVHPSVTLGVGTAVFAGAVIQPETVVGAHAIINTAAILDHDCRIGDFAHIAPRAALCGGVEIGEGTLVGVGASVVPGVQVGCWSTVGAAAAVVSDLPDRALALGVPARPVRVESGAERP